jgi:hypothetical protein
MPKAIVVPSLTVQPQLQPAGSSLICVRSDSEIPSCLYSQEMISLLLAVAVVIKAIALLVKALKGNEEET